MYIKEEIDKELAMEAESKKEEDAVSNAVSLDNEEKSNKEDSKDGE